MSSRCLFLVASSDFFFFRNFPKATMLHLNYVIQELGILIMDKTVFSHRLKIAKVGLLFTTKGIQDVQ